MNNNNGNFGMINLDNLDKVRNEQESNKNTQVENNNNNTNYNAYNNYNPSQYTEINKPTTVNVSNSQNNAVKANKGKDTVIFLLVILCIFLIIGMFAALILFKTGTIDKMVNGSKTTTTLSTVDDYAYISEYSGEYRNGNNSFKIIRTDNNEIDLQYYGVNDYGGMFYGDEKIETLNDSEIQFTKGNSTYKIRFNGKTITISSTDDEYGLVGTYTHTEVGNYLNIDGKYVHDNLALYVTQLAECYNVRIKGTVENGNSIDQYFSTTDILDDTIEFEGLNFITKIELGSNDSLLVTTENKETLEFKLAKEN